MSQSVEIGGVQYVPAGIAAQQSGYTSDYVARLARSKKIGAVRVGRQWFIEPLSLENFVAEANRVKRKRSEHLREERKRERLVTQTSARELKTAARVQPVKLPENALTVPARNTRALMTVAGVVVAGLLFGVLLYADVDRKITGAGRSFLATLSEVSSSLSQSAQTVPGESGAAPTEPVEEDSDLGAESTKGILVAPLDEMTEERAGEIERSFSDEVTINLDDGGNSGVIVPMFRKRTDERYRFLLVPIDQK